MMREMVARVEVSGLITSAIQSGKPLNVHDNKSNHCLLRYRCLNSQIVCKFNRHKKGKHT